MGGRHFPEVSLAIVEEQPCAYSLARLLPVGPTGEEDVRKAIAVDVGHGYPQAGDALGQADLARHVLELVVAEVAKQLRPPLAALVNALADEQINQAVTV